MTCSGRPCTRHPQSTVSHHTCTSSTSHPSSSCLPGTPRSSSCRCQHPRSGNGSLRTTSRRYKLLHPVRFQRSRRLSSGQSCTPCRTTSSRISRRNGLPDTCIRSVRSTEGMGRLTCSGRPCTRHPQSTVSRHRCTSSTSRRARRACRARLAVVPCRCQHPRSGIGSLAHDSAAVHALASSPSVDGIFVAAFVWPVLHAVQDHEFPVATRRSFLPVVVVTEHAGMGVDLLGQNLHSSSSVCP